jgi:hypothetical protein
MRFPNFERARNDGLSARESVQASEAPPVGRFRQALMPQGPDLLELRKPKSFTGIWISFSQRFFSLLNQSFDTGVPLRGQGVAAVYGHFLAFVPNLAVGIRRMLIQERSGFSR